MPSTARRILNTAIAAFAIVGFSDVLVRFVAMPLTGEFFSLRVLLPIGVRLEREASSPDGRYKAVVFSQEGSGLAPYCLRIVSVSAASQTTAASWALEDRVYVAECGRDVGLTWQPPPLSKRSITGRKSPRDRLTITANAEQACMVSRVAGGGGVAVSFTGERSD